jgi:phage shock protein C
MNTPFTLDKANGKLMGVCAGLSHSLGLDVTLVRILALLSILVLGGLTIPVYFVVGLVAPSA